MKIGLPNNNPNRNKSNKNKPKKGNNNSSKNNKNQNNNKKSNKPKKKHIPTSQPKEISWREKGEFITAIISRKLIKIHIETFTIYLPNGFSMKARSLEEAKKKAIDFLS